MVCFRSLIIWGLCLVCFWGCPTQPEKEKGKAPVFERVSGGDLPEFFDDLDRELLQKAVERSLTYYSRVSKDEVYSFGDEQVSVDVLRESLLLFLELLQNNRLTRADIEEAFDVFRSHGNADTGRILVTGYYEPILDGRLAPDTSYRYPIYGLPPDLLTIELKQFDPKRFSNERVVGRVEGNRVVPYYTRSEIDGQEKLGASGSQLVWLKDPIAAFFLHVQGSGAIMLPEEPVRRVGYAGANGRPYRSIGKYLQDKGLIAPEDMSLQSIRTYLKDHPEMIEEVLGYNESYVFFRWVKDGPVGSLGVTLAPGRSIATDPSVYPKGALFLLKTEKPRLGSSGEVLGWESYQRWVLNQDTGGAIRGPGRVDLFCGSGETAEWTAGRLKHAGELYLFIKKSSSKK
jgi:membrane-bound lytic murein transglycosylase A